jgi:type IV pilus assembly protein PilN
MVKINLLAEGKRPAIARKSKQPLLQLSAASSANYAMAAVALLAVLGAVGWYLVLENKIKKKEAEIRVAQREVDELQQVIKEVQMYEAKLKELKQKVEVITTLKENQRGPVRIMDEVSRALPDLLWLTGMDVTATNINFRGTAFNMSAVANFIDNLDAVEAFREPILQDTSRAGARGSTTALYNFRMTMGYSFKPQTPPAAAPAAGAPAGSAAGAVAKASAAKAAQQQGVD